MPGNEFARSQTPKLGPVQVIVPTCSYRSRIVHAHGPVWPRPPFRLPVTVSGMTQVGACSHDGVVETRHWLCRQ